MALDGLRGVAAFIVAAIFHYRHFYRYGVDRDPWWFRNRIFHPLVEHGGLAVDLFFLVSGVIFTHVYLGRIASRQVGGARFFVLRFARLYPLHVTMTIVMALLLWGCLALTGRQPLPIFLETDAYHLLLNLLMLQHVGLQLDHSFNFVSWTLSIEAACYCLFFYAARLAGMFDLLCAALAMFGMYLLFNRLDTFILFVDMGRGLFGFFAGCLIARGLEHGFEKPFAIVAIFLVAVCVVQFASQEAAVTSRSVGVGWTVQVVLLPSVLVLSLTVGPLRRLLSTWLPRKLGALSFGIYMVHISVQCVIMIVTPLFRTAVPYNAWWFYAGYVAAVLGIAQVVHVGVELPAQAWIRKRYS